MALIFCPDCHRQVSDLAVFCPGCGCPVRDLMRGLEGKHTRVRLHFNPLTRPGKLGWIVGMFLFYGGILLVTEPQWIAFLFGNPPMWMGKPFTIDPYWLVGVGLFFLLWATIRAFYWGCGHCGKHLAGSDLLRCPYCCYQLQMRKTSQDVVAELPSVRIPPKV